MTPEPAALPNLEAWVERARRQPTDGGDFPPAPSPLPAHVGLWLDRCYFEPESKSKGQEAQRDGSKPGRRALYDAAIAALQPTQLPPPAVANYKPFFTRWEQWAKGAEPGVLRWSCPVQATSRLLLHPATGSTVTEGGLLLHHTYGVPYLPGSALKGIARRRAFAQRKLLTNEQRMALFGFDRDERDLIAGVSDEREDEAGTLDFCDALWIPEPPAKDATDFSPLALDLVNPHHSDYYTQANDRPFPLESDEPVPTLLLTIRPGTRFLLVLEAPDFPGGLGQSWLDWVAEQLLLPALEADGIGARTRAGYGRLRADRPKGAPAKKEVKQQSEKATVSYQPGNQELTAHLADGKKASVRGPAAEALFQTLSDALKERIKKGKKPQVVVIWEPEGNGRKIVGIGEG